MTAQTWASLQTNTAAALVQAPFPYTVLPSDFAQLFPQATSYAEGRIYRDIVLLATRTQNTSLTSTASQRALPSLAAMPQPVIVPEGVALLSGGVWYPFDRAELATIDIAWPNQTQTLAPSAADWAGGRFWAMVDDHTIIIMPTPDSAYPVEITGLFQPTPIGPTNQTTYLATTYGDLMLVACMLWLSGALMRNFGAQADDPKMAMSWEGQYQELKAAALAEERRRRGLAPDVAAGR